MKITSEDGTIREIKMRYATGFISKMFIGEELDFVAVTLGATTTTGYCDSSSAKALEIRLIYRAQNLSGQGVFFLSSVKNEGFSGCLSRVCFKGNIVEEKNSDVFKTI